MGNSDKKHRLHKKFQLHFQSNVIFGLLILVPLWLTLFLAYYVFLFLADITYPLIADLEKYGLQFLQNTYLAYFFSFVLSITALYFVGIFAKMWLGKAVLNVISNMMLKTPIVGSFYKALKQLTEAFNQQEEMTQKKVVLISFPSDQMKTVGFVIKVFDDAKTGEKLASIYVPTTPNPTSGYLEVVPLDKTVPLDWTFEEAMSFIISGGSSMPSRPLSFLG